MHGQAGVERVGVPHHLAIGGLDDRIGQLGNQAPAGIFKILFVVERQALAEGLIGAGRDGGSGFGLGLWRSRRLRECGRAGDQGAGNQRGDEGESRVHGCVSWSLVSGQALRSARIMSAAFSPIMKVGALVLPPHSVGMIDASATRKPVMPLIRSRVSTTAIASLSGPILQVPTGWYWVSARLRISASMATASSRRTG